MALSRNVRDAICTVLRITVESRVVSELHSGRTTSTKSITFANRVIPGNDKIYGGMSDQFIHIGTMHSDLKSAETLYEAEEPLAVIGSCMKALAWLFCVAAELVSVCEMPQARFWRIVHRRHEGNEIVLNPSDAELAEIREFN
jgi:hypothetical protein